MMTQIKAFADKYTEKFISRKFLAWITATGLCAYGTVTSDSTYYYIHKIENSAKFW